MKNPSGDDESGEAGGASMSVEKSVEKSVQKVLMFKRLSITTSISNKLEMAIETETSKNLKKTWGRKIDKCSTSFVCSSC